MAIDKKSFLRLAKIYVDTREKEWAHIEAAFDKCGVKYERRKLDFGDYSFAVNERDFSMSCVVERKASVDELYGNLMHDRQRIEKEFDAGSRLSKQFLLLVEGVGSPEALREYKVPNWQMKAQERRVKRDIGAFCHATLLSWQSGAKFDFRTLYVEDKTNTAGKILEEFYYFWKNYAELVAARRAAG